MTERLQKILARAGLGSRRNCETLILQGRVRVDGRPAKLGMRVDPEQAVITVDGEQLRLPAKPMYVLVNKPRGVLSSTRSQGGKPVVTDLVPAGRRLFPVGRLDLESEGLMLLTDDGDLANRLMHPRYEHEKEYRVLLNRMPDARQLEAWRRGVVLADGHRTKPAKVLPERNPNEPWVRVVIREGHKRQIRETARALGLHVRRLIRVRFGPLELGDLQSGAWRPLREGELKRLEKASVRPSTRRAAPRKTRRKAKPGTSSRRRS